MKVTNKVVKQLLEHYKELSILGKVKATLDWDLNVNLPIKGAQERGEQSAYIGKLITNKWHSPEFKTLVEKVQEEKNLNAYEAAIVRNIKEGAKYYYSIPAEILHKKDELGARSFMAWKKAKETNTFSEFEPFLQEITELNRIVATHLGYKENPYDAQLNLFELGITAAKIDTLFTEVANAITPLTKQIIKSKKYKANYPFLSENARYETHDQKRIVEYVLRRMGYDFDAGRIDVSPHPFTIGLGQHDVRITNMYKVHDFRDSYTSSVHEGGHALYELDINPEYANTPLSGGVSYGIHEAMSRFWENMVGKNPEFLRFMAPVFHAFYPEQLKNTTVDDIIQSFNLVKPSFIRIEADEVTYSLHIILRFQMENELMNGQIKAKDAPEVWRAKSKKLFGLVPEKDSEGVLQDVHWAYGEFGYFPSYALGNLYGAQLLNKMKKEIAFEEDLRSGHLYNIRAWMSDTIHRHGSFYTPDELIKEATGESLKAKYFIKYLTDKYTKLYDLK